MFAEIKEVRKKNKITIIEMANYLNFKSPSTYCKKENGDIPITIEEAEKICTKLNISPLYFFGKKFDCQSNLKKGGL